MVYLPEQNGAQTRSLLLGITYTLAACPTLKEALDISGQQSEKTDNIYNQ